MNYSIRELRDNEKNLLEDFIYEAIFQKDGEEKVHRDIIYTPEVNNYIVDFGKKDDFCLVVDLNGKVIGAVWTRILSGEIKGYGNIDEFTPEFAISLYSEYRNMGIGKILMQEMLEVLKKHGYKKASLAVQKENYAVKLYKKVGFKIIKETEEEYIMVCTLNE